MVKHTQSATLTAIETRTRIDPADALVIETRQAYRKVLSRHGLLDFTAPEVAQARAALKVPGNARTTRDDLRFQASVVRLKSRNLSRKAVKDAVRELILAEIDCDQARWERDCHRAALQDHLRRVPAPLWQSPNQAKPLATPASSST